MIEVKKHFPEPWWSSQLQKLRDKRESFYKIFRENNHQQHLIQQKKPDQNSKFKPKKEYWEKLASSINSNTPINQALNRVSQLKGKDPKKLPSLKSMEHSTKTAKS